MLRKRQSFLLVLLKHVVDHVINIELSDFETAGIDHNDVSGILLRLDRIFLNRLCCDPFIILLAGRAVGLGSKPIF